ncbi:MAG TPA: orotidine 5'-phosphate decarboxylase / HUMPS family protein, partial [Sphingomicrobium sp.]|nr:orotidine 5'-phosphate decarboxylase / HUMPS family protein [Sphingomicrobium sp.]
FVCLTPGIRPEGTVAGDQTRVVTPSQAKEIGSTFIVIGRGCCGLRTDRDL